MTRPIRTKEMSWTSKSLVSSKRLSQHTDLAKSTTEKLQNSGNKERSGTPVLCVQP